MSEIKYKLLKELPFCSVGDKGYIQNGLLQFDYIDYGGEKNQHNFDRLEIKSLIEQGWIEEYKPKSQEELFFELRTLIMDGGKDIVLEKYEIKEKE